MKAWYFRWTVPPATVLQSLFLLVVRLYWGWGFFQAGSGKLQDLQKPTEFFQSLGIPFPHAQAILVGLTESVRRPAASRRFLCASDLVSLNRAVNGCLSHGRSRPGEGNFQRSRQVCYSG